MSYSVAICMLYVTEGEKIVYTISISMGMIFGVVYVVDINQRREQMIKSVVLRGDK